MKFDKLTDEQKAKLATNEICEEVLKPAKDEGHELTEDELEIISGGNVIGPGRPIPDYTPIA